MIGGGGPGSHLLDGPGGQHVVSVEDDQLVPRVLLEVCVEPCLAGVVLGVEGYPQQVCLERVAPGGGEGRLRSGEGGLRREKQSVLSSSWLKPKSLSWSGLAWPSDTLKIQAWLGLDMTGFEISELSLVWARNKVGFTS